MDYHPSYPQFHHLSNWLKVIFSGDYQTFLNTIGSHSEDDVQNLIKYRESMMRLNAIFHVVIGARTLAVPSSEQALAQRNARKSLNVRNEHMKILDKLLSLGADVNVRDPAGFTPLHHCLSRFSNKVTFKMAEKLIHAGADANARNRFGDNPLLVFISAFRNKINKADETVSLLLKNGADPYMINNFGYSAFQLSKAGLGPISYDLFVQLNDKNKDLNKKPGNKDFACGHCGKHAKTNKRCTGCYTVWYCSRDCQVKKWKQHGKICKEIQAKVCQKIQEWEPSRKC